jgi:hypothetical protein
MTHKFAGLIPEMLVREIEAKRCVLFVGAGLSAQAAGKDGKGLPTWKLLLEKMVDWCVDHRIQSRGKPADFLQIIEKGRVLVVAQEIQQSLGGFLNQCLADILQTGTVKPAEAHRLLCRIPWVAALTSNYDGLIEGGYAVESEGIVPPVFSAEGVNQAVDSLRNSRFFVFKIHGDVNIPGSIVLGNRDYSRLLYLSPGYRSFLETIFSTYTVLFLGFGGSDPDLEGITDRLSTIFERGIGQHFILMAEGEFSAIERLRLLEDKRLDCIPYQPDGTHSQVLEFLKGLIVRTTQNKEVASPFIRKAGREHSSLEVKGKLNCFAESRQLRSRSALKSGLLTRVSLSGLRCSMKFRRRLTGRLLHRCFVRGGSTLPMDHFRNSTCLGSKEENIPNSRRRRACTQ